MIILSTLLLFISFLTAGLGIPTINGKNTLGVGAVSHSMPPDSGDAPHSSVNNNHTLRSSSAGYSDYYQRRAPSKGTIGGVYICVDIHWGGKCGYDVKPLGICITLGADWKNKISSFGPDPGTNCYAYSQNSCTEAEWVFAYPGDDTGGLGTNYPWNDRITNFMCVMA